MLDHLAAFLAPLVAEGDLLVVAFSGGPDSTALLAGVETLAPALRVRLVAAHLDHGLDSQSASRAARAVALASRLEVPIVHERRDVLALRRPGESLEETARRVRYDFLEQVRERTGGRWIMTAHHRDDQAETVILRLRQGSGLDGLAGIRGRRGHLLRPLLSVSRRALAATCEERGLQFSDDPTNLDTRTARGLVRHRLLPRLAAETVGPEALAQRLAAVAAAAERARTALDRKLAAILMPAATAGEVGVTRSRLLFLPAAARPAALAFLGRLAGAPHGPSAASQAELWRQLEAGGTVGCDCGGGWRWSGRGEAVALRRAAGATARFTYTFTVPGRCDVPEIGWRMSLELAPLAPWMRRGDPRRAGLAAVLPAGAVAEVRNRRPGDRVHPLGAPGERKLKDLLIDRSVPRADRDRLPLLCLGGRIAWVPGITVDERHRLPAEGPVWLARLEEL